MMLLDVGSVSAKGDWEEVLEEIRLGIGYLSEYALRSEDVTSGPKKLSLIVVRLPQGRTGSEIEIQKNTPE
jgi:hypothetical protein